MAFRLEDTEEKLQESESVRLKTGSNDTENVSDYKFYRKVIKNL